MRLVTDYLEDALAAEDGVRFEAHIRGCGHCAAYLQQMRETIAQTGTLTPEDLSPSVQSSLLAAFLDWKSRPTALA